MSERIQEPTVILIYCTANDFNEDSLRKSMQQNYKKFKTYILDDSSDKAYKKRINKFAKKYGVKVVRRKDRLGFKAGNINNFFRSRKNLKYDYFVILDSDEIIPSDFITKSLEYFERFRNIGIVQANHIGTRNRNAFMKTFALGVDSHWPTYQMTKHYSGFLSLLGHGAMVSRECYEAAGGFPHVVAEDLCFSIEARIKGYYTAFANEIICEEEYPIDYLAFKKRHGKWTQGNMEFIKQYTKRIVTSNLTWFEKMDIFLFTYNLPLTAFFAFYIVINLIIFPLFNYRVVYPEWLLIPTIVFLFAPMLNDIIYYTKYHKIGIVRLVKYLILTFMLFGSMFYVSLVASFKSIFGAKAIFTVTPKESSRISLRQAIGFNKKEIAFAVVLLSTSIALNGNILPVVMIALPSLTSPLLTMMSNRA